MLHGSPGPRRAHVFSGRSALRAETRACLSSPGSNLVLIGAGGAGKTSTAIRALADLQEEDSSLHVVRFAATTATHASPLAVFMAVLNDHEQLAHESPDRVAKTVIAACLERAGEGATKKPTVAQLAIMIDDVPLLDNMSARVLDYLISRTDVRIVLTCRSTPGLGAALTRAWRDGVLHRLPVPALGRADVAEIAGELLAPAQLAPDTVTRLAEVSGGNALFLTELVRNLDRSSAMELRQGLLVWRRPLPAETSLADVVAAEMEVLTASQRTAFETLALIAPVPLRVIASLVELDTISSLADLGFVSFDERGAHETMATLAHPIYGEVISSRINKAQLASRFRALYESASAKHPVEEHTREVSDLLPLVLWGLNGGCVLPLALLLQAYAAVSSLADYEYRIRLATALFRHAEADDALRLTVLANRIEAHRFSNNPAEVEQDAQLVREIVERMPASAARSEHSVNTGLAIAEALVMQEGRWQEGLAVLDDAEGAMVEFGVDGALRNRLDIARGIYLGYGGRMRESVALQRNLYERMQSSPDFLPLASTLVISLAQRGETQRSRAVARQQMGLAVRSMKRHPLAVGDLVGAWCLADIISGNVREATLIFRLLNAAMERNPGHVRVRHTLLAFGRGLMAISAGEWVSAVVQLKIACAELDDFTGTGSEGLLVSSLALAQAATGDRAGAAENRARFAEQQSQSSMLLELPARYNLLLASLYDPNGTEAVEARALASRARYAGFALMELRALHALALCSRGRIEDSDMARVRELAERIGTPFAKLMLNSCEHIAGGGERSLGTAARALARRGLFIPSPSQSSELTEREKQLADLLALGFSNNQIAQRLFISKRTVESHAAKVLQKLRVASRDDVAEALEALE